ncbi:Trypsin domain containing protein [Asbolus verrucosus]|uniref:Trypsin domain containing protein n=1 Tax=Asbolus verrucosus TaxID=1661398 RepID=A0A482VGS3_ASBVE|nr:Trypsin domain containing protein [Asbolus verrucosus]
METKEGKDACLGDSGGPLLCENSKIIIGIVSMGKGCALANVSATYTKVESYLDFIEETIQTEGGYKDTCHGDSGGPLLCDGGKVIIGVISTGMGCGIPFRSSSYAKVETFLPFISEAMKRGSVIDDKIICTMGDVEGKDACHGDSGGPLLCNDGKVVIGIVSFGVGCGLSNMAASFTKFQIANAFVENDVVLHLSSIEAEENKNAPEILVQ